jgi:inosine/xanthosine triphosphatase
MTHVMVGSANRGKLAACRRAFHHAFGDVDVSSLAVPSGVAPSPQDDACFVGATNRARAAREKAQARCLSCDYAVGIEGGMVNLHGRWFGFSVTCVLDAGQRVGYGTSPLFELPHEFSRRVLEGTELGVVISEVTADATFAERRGAVGLLTMGLLTREKAHEYGVLAALAPHLSPQRYAL